MIPAITRPYNTVFEGLTFDSYDQFLRFMHTITEVYITLYEEACEMEDKQIQVQWSNELNNRLEKIYHKTRY